MSLPTLRASRLPRSREGPALRAPVRQAGPGLKLTFARAPEGDSKVNSAISWDLSRDMGDLPPISGINPEYEAPVGARDLDLADISLRKGL